MAEDIKRFLEEHRKAVFLAIGVVVLYIAFSVNSCTMTTASRLEQAEQQAQESAPADDTEQEAGADAQASPSQSQDDATSKLSDAQREQQANYDGETKEFLALLSASVWVSDSEQDSVTFSEKTYTVTASNETSTHPFVVDALDVSNFGGSDAVQIYTAAISNEEQTQIAKLTVDDSVSPAVMTLESPLFSNSLYKAAEAATSFSITGLNSSLETYIGGNADSLKQRLTDYCSVHYPTATTATWTQTATMDWSAGTLSTAFTLDTASKSQVEVTYFNDSNTFEIG